jgi:chitin synthase
MYRLRTADKGRPLIISDKIIDEYNDGEVDTLHKKNLLSLGEDRYLTTLMSKHFPYMSYKFVPDAFAQTAAPETWSVLLSQRRRWINSTIHNLAELVFLPELCGFCCFSMRFVVFIDLFGTIILPATTVYLAYLIVKVATHQGQFPLISIIMIAAVYGLQMVIFILKRQWQHIGWMIIYILAFPIYSFVLPLYSFWNQDNFSWGNTRIVIGEQNGKKVIAEDDEGFDPRSIPLQKWDHYADANELPGRRGGAEKGNFQDPYNDNVYEMDDMHSTYSAKPASTVLTGFHGAAGSPYMPPQSPAPFSNLGMKRQSTYSQLSAQPGQGQQMYQDNPYAQRGSVAGLSYFAPSQDNLLAMNSPPLRRGQSGTPLGFSNSRPASTVLGRLSPGLSPGLGLEDGVIIEAIQAVLADVDLDNVTKKQVRALVEQRLNTEVQGERRAFLDRSIDNELANM